MRIEEVLQKLERALAEAWALPLNKGKIVVDAEKVQTFIEDIRMYLPWELEQAKAIVAERKEILEKAKHEADEMIKKANDRVKEVAQETNSLKEAQEKSSQLLIYTENNAREIKRNISEFTEKVLQTAEAELVKGVTSIREALSELKSIEHKAKK